MFNSILNEVKIQDPYTKKWFDKTPEEYKKYYILFNKKYFNNELPDIKIENMTFKDADNPTNIGYSIFNINLYKQCLDEFSIKINKDYISNFDEFRNVLVHEMLHIYTYINVNIPTINWNKAFNYVKECNENKNYVNDYTLKNILGIDAESSHKGLWKEKADYLNKNFPEFDNKLSEKYDCSIDEDSYNDFIEKNKILYNATTDEIYFYDDLLDDSYINLMEVIKRGTTKQTKIVGKWYELIIDKNHFIEFIMKYKSNKVFKVNNFNSFKNFFIDKLNYINNVIYENTLKENYVFLYSSYDIIMRD